MPGRFPEWAAGRFIRVIRVGRTVKAIIVNGGLRETDGVRHEMVEWARSLGVNTKKAVPVFALVQDESGNWTAHFSIKRGPEGNPDGPDLIQAGSNRVQTDYGCTVIDVVQASWPRWFPAADDNVPDVPVSALLELISVVQAGESELRSRLHGYKRLGW